MKYSKIHTVYSFHFFKDLPVMEKINFKMEYFEAKKKYSFISNFYTTMKVLYKYTDIAKKNKTENEYRS